MDLPSLFSDGHETRVLRGRELLTPAEAVRLAHWPETPCFSLLSVPIPERLRNRGVVIQGEMGSGKSLTLLRLLFDPLVRMADPRSREKVIVVDVKGDLTSALLGMRRVVCPGSPLYLLNPFERFAHGIRPEEFADEPTRITRLVHALTYRGRDARSDPFFDELARSHLVDLVKILQTRARGLWGWRTLYLIATDYRLFLRVLRASRLGRRKAGAVVKKTFAGVVSTVQSWLDPYEGAFAAFEQSSAFSLDAFLRGRGILILTVLEDQIDSLAPLARLVLRTVKDRLLADTGRDPGSRTTIALDEFADLGEGAVPILMPLFGRARSAEVSLLCAWQSWPAVCDAHGERRMRGVVDNAAVRVWLSCGADSAEVASRNGMAAEVCRPEWSYQFGREDSATVAYRTELRTNVLPAEVQGLKPPSPDDLTVRGFLTASHLPGPLYCEEDYAPFVEFLSRLPKVRAIRERPAAERWLKAWDDAEDGSALAVLFEKERRRTRRPEKGGP